MLSGRDLTETNLGCLIPSFHRDEGCWFQSTVVGVKYLPTLSMLPSAHLDFLTDQTRALLSLVYLFAALRNPTHMVCSLINTQLDTQLGYNAKHLSRIISCKIRKINKGKY